MGLVMILHFYFAIVLMLAYWAISWSGPSYMSRNPLLDALRWTALVITFTTFVASRYLKRLLKVRA